MTMMPDHPIVRAAVTALDGFGATTECEARTLLGMWCRRAQLTTAQVAEVLAHYARHALPGQPLSLNVDWTDGRNDTPAGGPLPPHVKEWPVNNARRDEGEQR